MEALTPEEQESLYFLLNTLATLRPWEAQGHQMRPRVRELFLFSGAQTPLYRQGNIEQSEDTGVRWGGRSSINQSPSKVSSHPLVMSISFHLPSPRYQIWHHCVKSPRVVAVFLPPSSGSDPSANAPTIPSMKPELLYHRPTWIWGPLTKRGLW